MENKKVIILNAFQTCFDRKISSFLISEGVEFSKSIEENSDDVFLRFRVRHLEVFVFSNEAQIQGNGIDERYEPIDFELNSEHTMDEFCFELGEFIRNTNLRSVGLLEQIKNWIKDK